MFHYNLSRINIIKSSIHCRQDPSRVASNSDCNADHQIDNVVSRKKFLIGQLDADDGWVSEHNCCRHQASNSTQKAHN